jgi:uncharacterized repeat protein (TIGR01451 family)
VCGPKGCGTANRDLDDETCDITDFEVVPAHDPNAKAVSPSGNVVPGQTLSYTISYENEGQGTAFDVFVLDPVSEYLDDKTIALGNGGIYSDASRLASWDVGTLAAGQQGSVTMDVAVQAGLATGTQIINMAEVHFPSAGEVTPTNPVVSVVAAVAAHPQRLYVESGASLDIVLTGQEASGAPVTFSLTGKPLYGTLTGTAPNLTYAAEAGFAGTDSFSFVATSQGVDSDPARVAITVLPSSTDKTGAEIIGTFPEPDATDVGIGMDRSTSDSYLPIVSAQFSEAMDPATLDGTAFQIEGATGQVFFDAALRTVYFYPTEPLQPGTAYLATVNATAADSAGNPLAKPYSWTFTTVAAKSLRASLPPGEDGLGFGNVDVGTRSSPRFVSLESKGIESVTVSKIRIEGGNGQFSIAEQNCTAALDPDQSCFASVVFTPNAAGASTAQLVIDSDDPKQPSIVMLAGTGLIGDADAKDKSVGCSCRVGTSRRANHGAVVAGVLACAAVVFRRRRTRTTSNLRSSLLRSA